jgi:hypothetical protein
VAGVGDFAHTGHKDNEIASQEAWLLTEISRLRMSSVQKPVSAVWADELGTNLTVAALYRLR